MHLLLRRLTERSCLRAGTFTQSHPLQSLLGAGLEGSGPAHPLALANSGPLSSVMLLSPLTDAANAACDISRDEFEPFGPESHPGNRVLDLYGDCIMVHRLPSSKQDDVAEYIRNLDTALRSAEEDASCFFYLFIVFKSTIYNAGHYRSPQAYVQANPVNYDRKLPGPSTK